MEFASYKKDDESSDFPLQNLSKIQVLQEARHEFGNPNANPKKSAHLITKLLYVVGQGQLLTESEAQDVYVQSTMLFMNPDQKLRRMLYLIIKELSETSEEAYMAVNSLSNDMTKGEHKANAIRALRTIADLSTFTALDRHLEQSLVDKDPSVASAALLSALHLSDMNPEVVRRWQNKIQSAMMSSSHMVQYHALAVMYKLRHTDPLAVSKLVSASTSGFRSPLAHSLLIRYATQVLLSNQGNADSERNKTILKYLNTCLSYKNEMISIEAAKAMCSLNFLSASQLAPAVTALQSILLNYSNRPVHRFAAIRILNQLSDRFPDLVQMCQDDITDLIDDPNRNIATLAITTLLKSGAVTSIEKLLKQITSFMSNISDEFKIFVVEAMQLLIQKYPNKHLSIIKFLNEVLRDEGGYEFKKMIVDTMISVIRQQNTVGMTAEGMSAIDVKEAGIGYLCDFIEDCEFTVLLQRILHFLGKEGPNTKNPSQCIRYIYNRIILENPAVRATAVVTLSKFAAVVPSLKDSVLVLLKRSLQDTDDEVRDRAVACIESLTDSDLTESILSEEEDEDIDALDMEASLLKYISSGDTQDGFDLSMVKPVVSAAKEKAAEEAAQKSSIPAAAAAMGGAAVVDASATLMKPSKIFSKIPFLKELGKPFKSSDIIHLTEADSDYVVNCVKHVFPTQVVFQFLVKNQVEEHILEDVEMSVGGLDDAEGFNVAEVKVIPASKPIRFQQSDNILVCVPREGDTHPTGQFQITMTFKTRVFDVETQEEEDETDEDELELEEMHVSVGDYMVDEPTEFKVSWDEATAENESSEVIEFSRSESLQEALIRLESMIGLTSLVSTQVPEGKRAHNIFFSGKLDSGSVALVAASMREEKKGGILLQLNVRSEDEELREKLLASVTQ
uniref:Coatomer subunit gamma n=1 Tax=Percolomonas cosmopolitus TaxID=63605 RepID=A0A7S1KQR0_9EUKA|mmetsp:Transcript_5501/g.20653  ORF Transcript_5501/g.20653 Transcript_5501/m.20653 type:complete len:903 (+) Transcript_5501:199-2907(+)|eukprot:CAMPEP_0117441606 /NCGR_PEP_ID=MMETSP0759-20121206/3721_1 /TAXON_ID=63605 /ORGANISM="Percolomonas cosmopolitus, Strain WS" /LENGTH=902 /DNA_ID=CAMNT_0005233465 /DNA_START=334 /DNA_END=3042 /DNA_ORIENTATION=+